LSFKFFIFPLLAFQLLSGLIENYVASKGVMALYAGFHDQIRPLQSGAWRFCREPSGCDLEYKKDMTSTFATQFSSGRPKVGMRG
ncbi:hypothetical protein K0G48_20950, partial [Phocaeicola vulgatus]|nr:hypothetical protein [Phocaeicola vulgatus]